MNQDCILSPREQIYSSLQILKLWPRDDRFCTFLLFRHFKSVFCSQCCPMHKFVWDDLTFYQLRWRHRLYHTWSYLWFVVLLTIGVKTRSQSCWNFDRPLQENILLHFLQTKANDAMLHRVFKWEWTQFLKNCKKIRNRRTELKFFYVKIQPSSKREKNSSFLHPFLIF